MILSNVIFFLRILPMSQGHIAWHRLFLRRLYQHQGFFHHHQFLFPPRSAQYRGQYASLFGELNIDYYDVLYATTCCCCYCCVSPWLNALVVSAYLLIYIIINKILLLFLQAVFCNRKKARRCIRPHEVRMNEVERTAHHSTTIPSYPPPPAPIQSQRENWKPHSPPMKLSTL